MRSVAISLLIVLSTPAGVAQEAELSVLRPFTPVRIFTPPGLQQASWVGLRAGDIVIQRDGLRRVLPISAVDSVQRFFAPTKPGQTAMIAGAVVAGGSLALLYNGLCDYNCLKGTAAAGVIGALLGGVVGRAIGAGVSSARGEWVTIYRRQ